MTMDQQLTDLARQWTEAERAGSTEGLDAIAADDFTFVGPLGFILDKQQWVQRYQAGALVTHELSWEEGGVREYGDVAVVVGVVTQRASYRGTSTDGRFRVTQISVRDGDRRRLAGLHYSPITAPPA
ncbi:nuclear transport factor 2 family protein [Nonomuraea sp. NPDC005983]|uniref:nuclear transport factor 2 family protein n=1 Tax=Nonomuraea sp. NPDC005983 TaxID=3155595 RepID=UPI0033AB1B9E